jgi:predicted transcriptional regulator of viral defense system
MLRSFLTIGVILVANAALAQQPPPAKREIAPEYQEQAREKRELADRQRKADIAKVTVRDRAKFIIDCLEHPAPDHGAKPPAERNI